MENKDGTFNAKAPLNCQHRHSVFSSSLLIFTTLKANNISRIIQLQPGNIGPKKMKLLTSILIILVAALFFTACSNTKYLAKNQNLYIGSTIKLQNTDSSTIKNDELTTELSALIRPAPNSKFLGTGRLKLWFYNKGASKQKGLWHSIGKKWGEPPVIASYAALDKNRRVLQNRLENRGYFFNTVTVDTVVKNKKLTAIYTATLDSQYTIRNEKYDVDSGTLGKQIAQITHLWPKIRQGKPYNLDEIKNERTLIDARLKQRGFYYFNPDYLIAIVDTSVGNHQVDITMRVKRLAPSEAKQVYRINDVVVFADYNLNTDTTRSLELLKDTVGSITIIDPEKKFNPVVFSRTLGFSPGELYNQSEYSLALNKLTSLGVYKFVKASFQVVDTVRKAGNWLNAFYYLTPAPKKTLHFESSGYTKSNSADGGEVSINYTNRNFLRGAELFTAKVYGSIEAQTVSGQPAIGTHKYGTVLTLSIPRIISPIPFHTNKAFVPQTNISAGYELFERTSQYRLNTFSTSYGYMWKESLTKQHQLNVLSISFVNPTNITPAFQQQIDTNIVLKRSIERQFIIGSNYNFNFNTLAVDNHRKNNFYLNANVDMSGNLLGIITGANVDNGKEKKIFGSPFSQYIRGEVDFRHYLQINKNLTWVNRALTGLGYAWGNSNTMPFVKSFFAGGPNDIRAFASRSLGPGGYYAGNPRYAQRYLGDQPGDVKIELNSELRAKLFSIVQGAIFVDAGNTWLVHSDTARPGGKFGSNFMSQMAVGSGLGLRFDASILILRLDIGVPLRSPAGNSVYDWQFKNMSWSWLQSNWIWNIAIGFPF